MSSYCLECRKNMESKKPWVEKIKKCITITNDFQKN